MWHRNWITQIICIIRCSIFFQTKSVFFNNCWLINETSNIQFHCAYARALMPHLLLVRLALSPASVVLQWSRFCSWLWSGQSQWAVPLDTVEVFWCYCQYTPTLAICTRAFSPLPPRISLPSPQPGCCSVCQRCQHNDGTEKSFGDSLSFAFLSAISVLGSWVLNEQYLALEIECLGLGRRRAFLQLNSLDNQFFHSQNETFLQEGLALNFINPSFLNWRPGPKKKPGLHIWGDHLHLVWQD